MQGVQAGHGEIKREIELRVRVDVGIVRGNCGFFQFLPLESKCLRIIRWRGMVHAIPNIEATARDKIMVEFLLVFDELDAEEDAAQGEGQN